MLKHIRTVSFLFLCIALALLLLLSVILAIHVGAVELKPSWVFQILTNHIAGQAVFPQSWPGYADGIVWDMRLPKVLAAACVGAGLSIVGIMMQAMTKNAMADPYLLGISSGGEKQKVLIAGAFARNPELIVLDEPTNHLDIGYQFLILDMMKQRKGVTVFTSMHDMNMAMQYCDYLIALKDGRLFASGMPKDVLTQENLRQLFQVNAIMDPDSGYIRYTGFVHP